ncbi:MAG: tRNA lysidine(34) synthetase TilS [Elusimicrobia bacterium]|nr:tRNA lysidine(34) synthetase TilS [Elusimicrobiota bacterium]
MRRKQFAARVWSKLILFERSERLLQRGDHVLAAVSGGPDSVCLAHFLSVLRRKRGFQLSLLHVHHGLRGRQADGDERFVLRLGESLGVPVLAVKAAVAARAEERRKGLEDAGRELRYAAMVKAASRLKCNKAATGHQLDDQAETVLLQLLRGTRLSALGGIAPRRRLGRGLALIRPLLPLSRREVLEYLEVHGLSFRLDRSNLSPRFSRNWLRLKALPLLLQKHPRAREHLAGIAAQVRALRPRQDNV